MTAASALAMLAGCSSVKILKVTGENQPEGIPFYLPRPYVQVYEPFVVSSEVYLTSGRLSPDGQYLLVDNVKGDLGGTLAADTAKDANVRLSAAQVRLVSPPADPIGGPQSGASPPASSASTPKAGASAPADAASAPRSGVSAPASTASAPTSTPVGQFNVAVTQSDVPFPSTLGRRFFDVVWMPDFDEKYVVQGRPGLGNANIGVTMVQGWGLYGLDARIDNSAIVKPLLDFYSTGLDSLSKLARSKIAPASEFGAPQSGTPGASALSPESRVSVKVTKVFVAAPGLYPILKPAEKARVAEQTRPGNPNARVLVPFRPYTNVAFNIYEVLVVEAAKPTGDSPMNLQRYFDSDAQGNLVPTPIPAGQNRSAVFDAKDFTAKVNNVLAAEKGSDGAFWVISSVAVDGSRLKAVATLTGGRQRPAAYATKEQLQTLLSFQSERFAASAVDVELN